MYENNYFKLVKVGMGVRQDGQGARVGMLDSLFGISIQHLNLNPSSIPSDSFLGLEKRYGLVGRLSKPTFDQHIGFS